MNANKSKMLLFEREGRLDKTSLHCKELEFIKEFKYLGVKLSEES